MMRPDLDLSGPKPFNDGLSGEHDGTRPVEVQEPVTGRNQIPDTGTKAADGNPD